MKKILTAILIASTALIYSCGESTNPNVKTDKHQKVSGTNIFIIPPPGFVANSMGFSKTNEKLPENDVLILINEKQNESYSTALLKSKESVDEMVASGDKLLSKKDIKIGEYQGELTTVSHSNGANTIILYFGNEKFYGWVIGSYNRNIEEDGEQIKKAINTIVYDNTQDTPQT